MGVGRDIERFFARLFGRSEGGHQSARRIGVVPTEIVVHLPQGGARTPEQVADALRAAFPLGRTVQGVDLLTGAVELRIFYDVTVLEMLRAWLRESGAPHEISFLY